MTYRLRGNSFFLLLLRAAKGNLGNGNRSGSTRTGLWIDFMRVFDVEYNPRITKTYAYGVEREVIDDTYKKLKQYFLKQYFSEYLSGIFHAGSDCLPKNLPEKAKSIFSSDIDYSNFQTALEQINYACDRYLNLSANNTVNEEDSLNTQDTQDAPNESVMEMLVAGIIETIEKDDTFEGPFYTGYKFVDKKDLSTEKEFILQLFLFDVWYKIITEHYGDAKAGEETCQQWTQHDE